MKDDIQPLTPGQREIMAKIGAPELTAADIASHGIPHDKGEQRCQAVGGNAEGKVPTTAPVCASESPGSNPAAGADGAMTPDEATVADMLGKLLESLAKARDERDHEAARAKAAIRQWTKCDRARAEMARALESLMLCAQNALETMDHGSDRYDLAVSVENAKELLSGGGGAERQGEETCEQSRAASPSDLAHSQKGRECGPDNTPD
jgi:hypothetical protein